MQFDQFIFHKERITRVADKSVAFPPPQLAEPSERLADIIRGDRTRDWFCAPGIMASVDLDTQHTWRIVKASKIS